jgi:hypothetical protein
MGASAAGNQCKRGRGFVRGMRDMWPDSRQRKTPSADIAGGVAHYAWSDYLAISIFISTSPVSSFG